MKCETPNVNLVYVSFFGFLEGRNRELMLEEKKGFCSTMIGFQRTHVLKSLRFACFIWFSKFMSCRLVVWLKF